MELINAVLGDVPMVVAAGVIDRDTCGTLESALDKLFKARYNVIFLDLTNVTAMDDDGLLVLLTAVRSLKRGWIGLIGTPATILHLLEAEGLLTDPRIRVFENRQSALVATGERAST